MRLVLDDTIRVEMNQVDAVTVDQAFRLWKVAMELLGYSMDKVCLTEIEEDLYAW